MTWEQIQKKADKYDDDDERVDRDEALPRLMSDPDFPALLNFLQDRSYDAASNLRTVKMGNADGNAMCVARMIGMWAALRQLVDDLEEILEDYNDEHDDEEEESA
jgi:hypothetical protein